MDDSIEKLIERDQIAFRALVEEYQNRFLSMAYKYTNDYNDAEDLCQEIFIKIYQNISSFKNKSKLSTWLYKIAINTCIDWGRKDKRNLSSLMNFGDKEVKQVKSNHNTEDIIIYKEYQKVIHNTVYSLKDKYKSIIILYHFNQLTYKEISSILNISTKTIETRLYRARKQIKTKLIKEGFGGEIIELQKT
ncbi:RNA polymerase sigma factor [Vallitalea longa]|uniref:RNA polymerase sigma factor n=1 Tax=Vallitalea longa TaxID=2936439 RepID=A0A9W5YGF3_9FIRM|nr:RNA polymerase sigma factor [Vallitalea longa]GKX31838.1 RNA polymerase sigma factor [Vallitalea longa]